MLAKPVAVAAEAGNAELKCIAATASSRADPAEDAAMRITRSDSKTFLGRERARGQRCFAFVPPASRANNFDAIRLFAAVSVLFSHAFLIAQGTQQNEPFVRLTGNQCILGLLGVFVFFTISGFLVTQSFLSSGSAARFLAKRALRIFPGLSVSLLACAFLIGPAVSNLPLPDYLADPRLRSFLWENLTLSAGAPPLPGVLFADNPVGAIVNGSLWTLRYEVMMYLMVLALGMLRLLRLDVALALLILGIAGIYFEHALSSWGDLAGWSWLLSFFAAGMCLYFLRRTPLFRLETAIVAAIGLIAITWAHVLILLFSVFGGFLAIYLALRHTRFFDPLRRTGDLSYGIYIYGWPIEATVLYAHGGTAPWWQVFATALTLVVPVAWLSWRCVESPALRLARRSEAEADMAPAAQTLKLAATSLGKSSSA